jgi:hypothetical protein
MFRTVRNAHLGLDRAREPMANRTEKISRRRERLHEWLTGQQPASAFEIFLGIYSEGVYRRGELARVEGDLKALEREGRVRRLPRRQRRAAQWEATTEHQTSGPEKDDTLTQVRAGLDQRMRELQPLWAEYEQLAAAVIALEDAATREVAEG